MITGFTRTCLMIFPEEEFCVDRGISYNDHLRNSVHNMIEYLHKCGVEVHFFATDDVAHIVGATPDRWIQTLGSGDMFFLKNNVSMMDMDFGDTLKYQEMYLEAAEAHPIEKGASIDKRFEIILKRDYVTKRQILKQYSMVVNFKHSKGGLKCIPKAGSNKLIVEVQNMSFLPTSYMSDTKVDIVDLLGIPNANMPVYEWKV